MEAETKVHFSESKPGFENSLLNVKRTFLWSWKQIKQTLDVRTRVYGVHSNRQLHERLKVTLYFFVIIDQKYNYLSGWIIVPSYYSPTLITACSVGHWHSITSLNTCLPNYNRKSRITLYTPKFHKSAGARKTRIKLRIKHNKKSIWHVSKTQTGILP